MHAHKSNMKTYKIRQIWLTLFDVKGKMTTPHFVENQMLLWLLITTVLTASGSEVLQGGLVISCNCAVISGQHRKCLPFQYLLVSYLIKWKSFLLQIWSSFLFRKYGTSDMVMGSHFSKSWRLSKKGSKGGWNFKCENLRFRVHLVVVVLIGLLLWWPLPCFYSCCTWLSPRLSEEIERKPTGTFEKF